VPAGKSAGGALSCGACASGSRRKARNAEGVRDSVAIPERLGTAGSMPAVPRPTSRDADRRRQNMKSTTEERNSQTWTSPEPKQYHEKIELSGKLNQGISEKIIEMYCQGLSLTDISKQTGKAKSTIQKILTKSGVELRSNRSAPVTSTWRSVGKRSIRPPYGFCYFQGRVVPDQREYENLLLIHRLWKESVNPNAIADRLNAKKVLPRSAATWNRNSVVNIIERFKSKTIVINGDAYELR